MDIVQKIQILIPHRALLNGNLIGIEKEGLRVSKKGGISQAQHPPAFGCALTHPNITTDFSESLIELVTPPLGSPKGVLSYLSNIHHYLYYHLPKDQNFWPASMPCVIRGEDHVPIAKYGSSNRGMMKTLYRNGLANRYGSVMQTIAGIHFNYSFTSEFLEQYHSLLAPRENIRTFIDDGYMGLTRNVIRNGWLITYLFGASPAVCKSFLKGYHKHSLVEFNASTLFRPYATSLRMGDIGYQNLREDEAGVKANYNSLSHYIHSLQAAMQTSCKEYEDIGLKKHGKYQQLNTNILQIENEYYASIRPKPLVEEGKKPLDALNDKGIGYIELRSIDINPLYPLGIDEEQILFLEAYLLFCLLEPSPVITNREQFEIDNNDQLVAHEGRRPGLLLTKKGQQCTLEEWGQTLVDSIELCTQLLSKKHRQAVVNIARRIKNPDLTPSAITLDEMKNRNQGFFDYVDVFAKQYRSTFLSDTIDTKYFDYLDQQTKFSCAEQLKIEQADDLSFDEFLENYFAGS